MTSKLDSLCVYAKEKVSVESLNAKTYISTENMMPNKGGVEAASSLPSVQYTQQYLKGDVLVSNIRPYFKKIWLAEYDGGCSNDVLVFRANSICSPTFLYYVLANDLFFDYATATSKGTKMPRGDKAAIMQYDVPNFEMEDQLRIGNLLRGLDERIIINKKINDNLQQQAAALFESWFVNYDPWDGVQPSEWENAPLGSFVEIKRGGSPRPIQDFLSDSGLRWLKISDVTSLSSPFVLEIKEHIKEEGLRKTVFLHAGELVLSNSATPGIPKILDVDTCIHDGWLYFPKSELSKYYLYLFFKHIRKELVALGNGSVFTNLKTDILKAFPATKADESTLKEFDALVTPLFDAMLNADRENFKLAAMRDALLPKLMSSEIDVSEVEL